MSRVLRSIAVFAACAACAACGGSDGSESSVEPSGLPPLLTAADLGDGWIESEATPVPLTPAAVATPCPFTSERPDITVSDATSVILSNEDDEVGVTHTVVELDGDVDDAASVAAAWASMDCTDSDFDQSTLDGVPDGTIGVTLTAQNGTLTQVVLVETEGSAMSFMVISGNHDTPLDLGHTLANRN